MKYNKKKLPVLSIRELYKRAKEPTFFYFVVEGGINVLAGKGGCGKTFLAYAMTYHALKNNWNVMYFDLDNPAGVPKQRGFLERLLEEKLDSKILYMGIDTYVKQISNPKPEPQYQVRSPMDFLTRNITLALNAKWKGLVIVDSLANFCKNVVSDDETANFFAFIRQTNLTFLILHHVSRTTEWVKGSSNVLNMPDMVFQIRLDKEESTNETFRWLFVDEKHRYQYWDRFSVEFSLTDWSLMVRKSIFSKQEKFVLTIACSLLEKNKGMPQNSLISAIKKKDPNMGVKRIEAILSKYSGNGEEFLLHFDRGDRNAKMYRVNKESYVYKELFETLPAKDEPQKDDFVEFLTKNQNKLHPQLQKASFVRCNSEKIIEYRGVPAILSDIHNWTREDIQSFYHFVKDLNHESSVYSDVEDV